MIEKKLPEPVVFLSPDGTKQKKDCFGMTGEKSNYSLSCERSRLAMKLSVFAGVYSLLMALLGGIAGGVYDWAGNGAFGLGTIPFAIATLFALASAIYSMLAGSASEEEFEKELLRKRKESASSILDVSEDVRFTAGRTFRNYNKYAPAVFSLLAFILTVLGLWAAWRIGSSFGKAGPALPKEPMTLAVVSAFGAAASLFIGAFLAGQSRVHEFRWLRPVAAWLVAGAAVWILALIPAIALHYENAGLELPVAKIVFAVLTVLAAEQIFNFITEFYRPRTQLEERPLHESRLLALFVEPGSVAKNITDALDYQFGFKISGTSLYSAFCRVALPAISAWLLVLWLSTGIAEVGPGELGILTRFGRIVENSSSLKPGIYLKLPWPCEEIVLVPVDKPREFTVGAVLKATPQTEKGKAKNMDVILWTEDHSAGENPFLVANDSSSKDISAAVSLLNASLPITYKVKPEHIIQFAFGFENVERYLTDIGTREATIYFASTDFIKDMSTGRMEVSRNLQTRIQAAVDKAGLGVEIYTVNLLDTHPPLKEVAPAFEEVFCAQEEMGAEIEKAEAYKTEVLADAQINVLEITSQAETYKYNVEKVSSADAFRFKSQLEAYRKMPEMYKLRTYLSFLETDCEPLRKYIVASSIPYQILELNAEEKPRMDLTDTDLGELK